MEQVCRISVEFIQSGTFAVSSLSTSSSPSPRPPFGGSSDVALLSFSLSPETRLTVPVYVECKLIAWD